MNLILIGIGQPLRGDDGAGRSALECWVSNYPPPSNTPPIRVAFSETPGLNLLDLMQDADIAILVDAISTGSPPGTIRIYDPLPDLPISTSGKTAHGFGVAETIALARHAGTYLPDRIILVGIEGQRFEMGGTLSNPVIRSLSKAASEIQRLISVFSQS